MSLIVFGTAELVLSSPNQVASGIEGLSCSAALAILPLASAADGKENFSGVGDLAFLLTSEASGKEEFSGSADFAFAPPSILASGEEEFIGVGQLRIALPTFVAWRHVPKKTVVYGFGTFVTYS